MTQTKTFRYKSSLASKMAVPGGKSVGDALRAAEGALETHRDAAMQSLNATLTDLDAVCARRARSEVYERASALLDMAGFFDTGPLHPAVFGLCEVSVGMEEGAGDWPTVEVHLRAIRMILAGDCRASENTRLLLEGLTAVRQRLAGAPGGHGSTAQ
ncbi:hypothetical protein N0B44_29645 [Roseibacterium beibuensis]|uniref:hypothetical protein n=1 Tax=[Roseibacterium] beibuensis TaxID=1193142 RepID=UPI00217DAB9E|nr:hypothetical protein [Roseibacterium beibuensis]MCS6627085.1 hypothetical protein [Roseibacterium beibuensis]